LKARALLAIDLGSDREAFLEALGPETRTPITGRAKVKVRETEKGIALEFEASDLGALRSSISAYARWLVAISESLDALSSTRSSHRGGMTHPRP